MKSFLLLFLSTTAVFAGPPDDDSWGSRLGSRRNLVARGGGLNGPGGSEAAVTQGLRWLARQQQADGRWPSEAGGRRFSPIPERFFYRADHDVASTGLALMAFLGAGYTHLTHETYVDPFTKDTVNWGRDIRAGLKWLMSHQRYDGRFSRKERDFDLFDHAIASTAMFEAAGMTGSTVLKDSAKRALDALLEARTPLGGWGDGADPLSCDVVPTTWCVLALRAARRADLEVPDEVFEESLTAILRARACPAGFQACEKFLGETPRENWVRHDTLLAAEMLARICSRGGADEDALGQGAESLLRDVPSPGRRRGDALYAFFGSFALQQLDGATEAPTWRPWNQAMLATLLPLQDRSNFRGTAGAWDCADDRWGESGNGVAVTSLNVMALEVYYRYVAVAHPRKR